MELGTLVYHSVPWHTSVSQSCGTLVPWCATKMYHRVPWCAMVCHNFEAHSALVCHGVPWCATTLRHTLPWCALVFLGVPWCAVVCHGVPRCAIVCLGVHNHQYSLHPGILTLSTNHLFRWTCVDASIIWHTAAFQLHFYLQRHFVTKQQTDI